MKTDIASRLAEPRKPIYTRLQSTIVKSEKKKKLSHQLAAILIISGKLKN